MIGEGRSDCSMTLSNGVGAGDDEEMVASNGGITNLRRSSRYHA